MSSVIYSEVIGSGNGTYVDIYADQHVVYLKEEATGGGCLQLVSIYGQLLSLYTTHAVIVMHDIIKL